MGFIAHNIFANHKIPQHLITDHLIKIFRGYMYATAANDHEFISEYLEKNFSEKVIKNLEYLKSQDYNVINFLINLRLK